MIDPDLRDRHDGFGNCRDLLSAADADALDRGDWKRAGGTCACTCGRSYYDHVRVLGALWLTRLCDGSLVKL
jgi:hypothetical protein